MTQEEKREPVNDCRCITEIQFIQYAIAALKDEAEFLRDESGNLIHENNLFAWNLIMGINARIFGHNKEESNGDECISGKAD